MGWRLKILKFSFQIKKSHFLRVCNIPVHTPQFDLNAKFVLYIEIYGTITSVK